MKDADMAIPQTEQSTSICNQQPNPSVIFETLNRYQHTMALKGAIDLELFTHIADSATTAATIAARCNASERGIRILCDFLTIAGFLTKAGENYGLTQDSAALLNKKSPAYMGTMANFLVNDEALAYFRDVAAVVRKGGTLAGAGSMEPENDDWVEFARSMVPIATLSARLMAPIVTEPGKKQKVLDIAAGHGMFGISVALANPAAEIVAVDWKNVLAVATENAERAGVQDRFHTIPGSAFEVDFGNGYDVVLIPNFLHHFNRSTNVGLLKKIRGAVNPKGLLATLEFVPNDDRVSPPIAAAFSMIMLARTEHGDAYTFRELDEMFRDAGFGKSRMQDLEPSPQRLILTEL
jgi:2-polyprenyl-3-methyl-5-hydroxy-6-metoxy-1,4-benzoquinol methylase